MNGKENIINKILSDADEHCAKIIAAARLQAEKTVQSARETVQCDRQALDARLQSVLQERIRNANANAELEAKKYRLNAKQQLVSDCYDEAYKHLASLSKADRLDFIGTLLSRFAEDGETVYITKEDGNSVTPMWLRGFEKNLTLGNRYIRADGGVVLEGDGYEKDLTLKNVVRYLREQTEGEVASKLGVRNE